MTMIRMRVKGLALDSANNSPIVLLAEEEGERVLPIWIGLFEANAIAMKLEEVEPVRPMTHDLIGGVIRAAGALLTGVVIHDLKENTYYASLHLLLGDREMTIDARPSDAIALALRAEVPIWVAGEVLEEAAVIHADDLFGDEEKMKEWIDNIRPEDFGSITH